MPGVWHSACLTWIDAYCMSFFFLISLHSLPVLKFQAVLIIMETMQLYSLYNLQSAFRCAIFCSSHDNFIFIKRHLVTLYSLWNKFRLDLSLSDWIFIDHLRYAHLLTWCFAVLEDAILSQGDCGCWGRGRRYLKEAAITPNIYRTPTVCKAVKLQYLVTF